MPSLTRRSFVRTGLGGTALGLLPVRRAMVAEQTWTARLGPAGGSQANGLFALGREPDAPEPRMVFALAVWDIERDDEVSQAHIHDRDTEEILVWLYPIPDQRATQEETVLLAAGRFRDDDPTGNQGINDIADLVAAMDAGETIVNAHSDQYPVVATGPIR